MSLTERLFRPILRDEPARPLITFYDDADGSRVELSAATLGNWAAKTANWLRDECDLKPGDPVHVALPAHWQAAGALLGAWWCGAHIVDQPDGAAVSLAAPDQLAGDAAIRAALSLDTLGRGLDTPPSGWLDFTTEVRVHGDHFYPDGPVPADTPALLGATVDQVAATAAVRAGILGITRGDRVLSTLDWTLPDGLTDGLLAVFAARASLVHCTNLAADADPAALTARRTTERVTVTLANPTT